MKTRMMTLCCTLLLLGFILEPVLARAADNSFIGSLNTINQIASTVPQNGDVNPYGVAVVPASTGALVQGHILVSNFNNRKNLQGTGTTIMDIAPDGTVAVFADINAKKLPGACPGGVGLTTALAVLSKGWVIVGSLPTTDGTAATAQAGCLLVLNSTGQVVETFSGNPINGPWDMTALDGGDTAQLFVSNVLNGTVDGNGNVVNEGTVVRIDLSVPDSGMPTEVSLVTIASGLPEKSDPDALVIGPTGVGLSAGGTLYLADTLGNRIAAIPKAATRLTSAGVGATVSSGGALNGPLGLAIAPNGDILTANSGDGNLVETTPHGKQVAVKGIDLSGFGAGTLFGIAIAPGGTGVYFVDDGNNTLDILD
jgi:hypothetical protein